MKNINELAQRVHKLDEKWWQHPVTKERIERNKGELLMLVITKLAEACEGERRNLMDDKLPHRKMAEVEMADAYIRLCDFAAGFGLKLIEGMKRECEFMPDNKGECLFTLCLRVIDCKISDHTYDTGYLISQTLNGIEDYCVKYGYDLEGAIEEKLEYNAKREDHKHEARLQAGGKKW